MTRIIIGHRLVWFGAELKLSKGYGKRNIETKHSHRFLPCIYLTFTSSIPSTNLFGSDFLPHSLITSLTSNHFLVITLCINRLSSAIASELFSPMKSNENLECVWKLRQMLKPTSVKWLTLTKWMTGNEFCRKQIRNATQCQMIRFSGIKCSFSWVKNLEFKKIIVEKIWKIPYRSSTSSWLKYCLSWKLRLIFEP